MYSTIPSVEISAGFFYPGLSDCMALAFPPMVFHFKALLSPCKYQNTSNPIWPHCKFSRNYWGGSGVDMSHTLIPLNLQREATLTPQPKIPLVEECTALYHAPLKKAQGLEVGALWRKNLGTFWDCEVEKQHEADANGWGEAKRTAQTHITGTSLPTALCKSVLI